MFARGHFVMVEIIQKMEGSTALVGGMAVLGALGLIVIFFVLNCRDLYLIHSSDAAFFVKLAADLSFYMSLPRVCLL